MPSMSADHRPPTPPLDAEQILRENDSRSTQYGIRVFVKPEIAEGIHRANKEYDYDWVTQIDVDDGIVALDLPAGVYSTGNNMIEIYQHAVVDYHRARRLGTNLQTFAYADIIRIEGTQPNTEGKADVWQNVRYLQEAARILAVSASLPPPPGIQ